MRFALIDKIIELHPRQSITAIKNVSLGEEYLGDHFPGFPILPGVLMMETLVQAGAWLLRHDDDFQYSTILLKQVRGVKFINLVPPGNTLVVKMEVKSREGDNVTFQGTGTVNGQSAVSGRITLERFNLSVRQPHLSDADSVQVQAAREMFAQLWKPPTLA